MRQSPKHRFDLPSVLLRHVYRWQFFFHAAILARPIVLALLPLFFAGFLGDIKRLPESTILRNYAASTTHEQSEEEEE